MWVIYGRLQIDIWTVDHRCVRITYNPLWMWTGYPDLFYLIGLWPPTLWTGFPDLFRADHPQRGHLSSCELYCSICFIWIYIIRSFVLYHCHYFYMITLVYILLVIVFNFELWLCTCYLLCNIWCIGTEPYFTEETEEGQTFQTFEPTDEPEWDVGDGFGAVWASTRENVTLGLF